MKRLIILRADKQHEGRTLKQIMRSEYSMSSTLISRMKTRESSILVNGVPRFVNFAVHEGDEITFVVEAEESGSESLVPMSQPVDIIYEDEDILLINKPAGLPCHPVIGNRENTLANYLASHYLETGQSFTARVINRLDNDTSGLVLFAKNALSAGILNDMARRRLISKEYTAITLGIPPQKHGEIATHLRRKSGSSIMHEVCCEEDGKEAVTIYDVMASDETKNLALLHIRTLTGRTHQIRVHMAHIGCPLAGDFLYGTEDKKLIARHALHMGEMHFTHPLTKVPLSFSVPLPEDLRQLFPFDA